MFLLQLNSVKEPLSIGYNIGTLQNENKPGPAQVGAISKAQK